MYGTLFHKIHQKSNLTYLYKDYDMGHQKCFFVPEAIIWPPGFTGSQNPGGGLASGTHSTHLLRSICIGKNPPEHNYSYRNIFD
jgi:hypothetical protein